LSSFFPGVPALGLDCLERSAKLREPRDVRAAAKYLPQGLKRAPSRVGKVLTVGGQDLDGAAEDI